MDTIRLNEKDLKRLKLYDITKSIKNIESDIYIYNNKELLKIIKRKETLENKFYVLNKLFFLKKHIEMKEIVFPNKYVKISGIPSGYLMDFIKENTNIGLILNNDKVTFDDKIFFLKKIGQILRKIERNEMLKSIDFHLGDIHEFNFIYDNKENMVKTIDIDSAYVKGSEAPISKFLHYNDKLWDFPNKYPMDIETDIHIPNKNTTIISYIYMLLNTITNDYSPNFSISQFVNTLNTLLDAGFNKELLDSIYNIYLPKDNYLDFELLNTIKEKQYNKFKELQLKKVKK